MVLVTKGTMWMEENMDRENSLGLMVVCMKESFLKIILMVMVRYMGNQMCILGKY